MPSDFSQAERVVDPVSGNTAAVSSSSAGNSLDVQLVDTNNNNVKIGGTLSNNALRVGVFDSFGNVVNATNPGGALSTAGGFLTAGTSASAVTVTGANSVVDLGAAYNNISVVITGTSTSYTVTLEGSADNATFVPAVATSGAQTSTPFLFANTGKPLRFWRTNVTAIANGNVTTKISAA